MDKPPPIDRETLDALESLSAAQRPGAARVPAVPVAKAGPPTPRGEGDKAGTGGGSGVGGGPSVTRAKPPAGSPTPPAAREAPASREAPRSRRGAHGVDSAATGSSHDAPGGAVAGAEGRFRCVGCGYPLMAANGHVCSECGASYALPTLERWFGGAEASRYERVLWLVRVCAFLKLWLLWDLRELATLASAVLTAWACWIAGEGKRGRVGWQYAVCGMTVSGLMLMAGWTNRGTPAVVLTLEMLAACLLLVTMLRDADGVRIVGEPFSSRVAIGIILATPVLSIVMHHAAAYLEIALRGGGGGLFSGPSTVGGLVGELVPLAAPQAAALAVWLFVWWRLGVVRGALFGRRG